ncbi:MAG: alpha/beta fold hydrolase [Flavobacteriales bacterium]|jgi:pimeloyl-ACP methyl ester carboxylesterase|nr:alpha/beta fold hydrolase [Flavobacteriales bacterium]
MIKSKQLLIAPLLCLLFNIGCKNATKEEVEAEVLKASQTWISNFNKGNIKAIKKAYAKDAVMEAKPYGTYKGQEAIIQFWEPFIQSGASNLKYTNVKVRVVNSTKAIVSADWSMNVGSGLIINETWEKTNDKWKLTKDFFEVNRELKAQKQKATYVLVHSAWLGGWQWGNVAEVLIKNGHKVFTPNLPGHGNDQTPSEAITMDDYVNTIINIIDNQEEPVILVGHSFNGITVSRVAELRPNKVKSLVYLTAFLLPNGGSFFKAVQGVEGSLAVENFYLSEDQKYGLVKEDEIQNAFAHDISEEAFNKAKSYIVPEPVTPLMYELEITAENFGKIPKYYIECTEDRAIPISVQQAMYKGKVKKSYTLNSSHTPNFSQPEKLAEILLEIGNEK